MSVFTVSALVPHIFSSVTVTKKRLTVIELEITDSGRPNQHLRSLTTEQEAAGGLQYDQQTRPIFLPVFFVYVFKMYFFWALLEP